MQRHHGQPFLSQTLVTDLSQWHAPSHSTTSNKPKHLADNTQMVTYFVLQVLSKFNLELHEASLKRHSRA